MIEHLPKLSSQLALELLVASSLSWVAAGQATRFLHIADATWRTRFLLLPLLIPVSVVPLVHLIVRPLWLGLPHTPLEKLLASMADASPLMAAVLSIATGLALVSGVIYALRPLAEAARYRLTWERQRHSPLWLRCNSRLQSLALRLRMSPARLILTEGRSCGSLSCGPMGSYVIVSKALVSGLDDEEMEGLLAHELGHIKRKDTILGVAVGVCRRLLIFSPFAQHAYRRFAEAQEEAVDDLAVRTSGRPLALASCLVKACRLSQSQSPRAVRSSLLPSASSAEGRIQRLLNHSTYATRAQQSYSWAFLGVIAIVIILLLITV